MQIGYFNAGGKNMNAYTDLKDRFDHLQKRTMQLFAAGKKREDQLKEALSSANDLCRSAMSIAERDGIGKRDRRRHALRSLPRP